MRFLGYLFILLSISCSAFANNPDIEFSSKFLSSYYQIKKLSELKSFLHPDMINSMESEGERSIKMTLKSDEFISRWENVSISYLSSSLDKDTLKIKFKISGMRLNKQSEEIQTVYLKKYKDVWKVYALA